jgi:hypothetical protein
MQTAGRVKDTKANSREEEDRKAGSRERGHEGRQQGERNGRRTAGREEIR